MKIIELFAGSCSFSNVAKEFKYETFTTDWQDFKDIDLVANILDLEVEDFPFKPDIIWASPPCTTFSVASIGHHWKMDDQGNHIPKTKECLLGIEIVKKTKQLILDLDPKYFIIENPRGKLRKLDLLAEFKRDQVSYCKYGDKRMKPTDLWHNLENFDPKMCKNGTPNCHTPAPRGSSTGTQGLKGDYERSKVPEQLCREILELCV